MLRKVLVDEHAKQRYDEPSLGSTRQSTMGVAFAWGDLTYKEEQLPIVLNKAFQKDDPNAHDAQEEE